MRHDKDAALLSLADRRAAIAAILAEGVLRLRNRAALPPLPDVEEISESGQDCLEVAPKTVLSVHVG